jgi:hypothetical protein
MAAILGSPDLSRITLSISGALFAAGVAAVLLL